MTLAWMVSASFAALMPRYCKKAWPGKKVLGKDIWFQVNIAKYLGLVNGGKQPTNPGLAFVTVLMCFT